MLVFGWLSEIARKSSSLNTVTLSDVQKISPAGCIYIYYICILRSRYILLSTLMDWVESLSERRSLFALCIAHCSQFEHSGDSTMQSYNV